MGHTPARTPIWFMRQAGRCLPEYRAIRERMSTLEMFLTPQIAIDVTLQPLRRFDYDAAIVYADILHIADALGCGLSFVRGEGPQMSHPVQTPKDMERIRELWKGGRDEVLSALSFITETIHGVRDGLESDKTLIGFAGSPWSVASYMVEGRSPGLHCVGIKKWMFHNPDLYHQLMTIIGDITVEYLVSQSRAGAEVLQLFESHSGVALSYSSYRDYVLPYITRLFREVHQRLPDTPLIYYFGNCGGKLSLVHSLLPYLTALSVDHRMSLGEATRHPVCRDVALQGNIDPDIFHASPRVLEKKTREILGWGTQHTPGYIFNVGQGIKPDTPLQAIETIISLVHSSRT